MSARRALGWWLVLVGGLTLAVLLGACGSDTAGRPATTSTPAPSAILTPPGLLPTFRPPLVLLSNPTLALPKPSGPLRTPTPTLEIDPSLFFDHPDGRLSWDGPVLGLYTVLDGTAAPATKSSACLATSTLKASAFMAPGAFNAKTLGTGRATTIASGRSGRAASPSSSTWSILKSLAMPTSTGGRGPATNR